MSKPYERSIEVLSDGELATSPTHRALNQKFSPLKHPAASAAAALTLQNQARKRVDIEILSDDDATTACSTHPKASPPKRANFSGVPVPRKL